MTSDGGDEFKAICIVRFSGKREEWDEWSVKFKSLASERGYLNILESTEVPPADSEVLEEEVTDTDAQRAAKAAKLKSRNSNRKGYRDLTLATNGLAFKIVNLAKTTELPKGCLSEAWKQLLEEYSVTEGDDKVELLEAFQNNKLTNVNTNVTEWLKKAKIQVS